jgi:hypothetical protein
MKSSPKAAIAVAAVAALGVTAPTAGAKVSNEPCDSPPSSKVFSQFNDLKTYFLAPDGGFEAGADGWNLDGGASVVDGNESFNLNDAADSKSLSLPAGSDATSPKVCVSRKHPQFRFVAKRTLPPAPETDPTDTTTHGGSTHVAEPRLRVEIIYLNGKGHRKTRVAAKLRAGDAWQPTKKIAIATGRATGRGKHKSGDVKFRFTPIGGTADWQIDDLYVDPYRIG